MSIMLPLCQVDTDIHVQSETTRAAVDKLQKEMEKYHVVMTGTVERNIDTVLKYGTVIAEVSC